MKRKHIELPTGQLTLKQLYERRDRILEIEARELAAMRREAERERAELSRQRERRAVEAEREARARGSMTLPRMIRGV
jgi:hypothetical protein